MSNFLSTWAVHTWVVILDAAPWLLAGFLLAGLIHALLPVGRIATHLGRPGFLGVLKAAALGVPLPLCSCSVIPLASMMRRGGASRGATAGFLISTPETGVDSISITYALMGPVMAILRPIAALLSAISAGVLIDWFASKHDRRAEVSGFCTADSNSCAAISDGNAGPSGCGCDFPVKTAGTAKTQWLKKALHYGFVEMFVDLSIWLLIGFTLAGLISAVVPEGFIHEYRASGILAMLLMMVISAPLYVCATSSTPIAAALVTKGLSPGTALVFLLVGPATNIATMMIVAKELGIRSLLIYLISIVAVAVGLGLLVDALLILPMFKSLEHGHTHEGAYSWWTIFAGIVFIGLMVYGLFMRWRTQPGCSLPE